MFDSKHITLSLAKGKNRSDLPALLEHLAHFLRESPELSSLTPSDLVLHTNVEPEEYVYTITAAISFIVLVISVTLIFIGAQKSIEKKEKRRPPHT
jgi:hypothetical protein